MLNGDARFEVTCSHCPMHLAVDRIRQPEITVMTTHLREEHLELGLNERAMLGEVLEHYRVRPTRR